MTAFVFPTRRMLLRDMGKAGLAVMILGTAACASESTDNATPTAESTAGGTSSTGSSPMSTTGSTAPTPETPSADSRWHRVNLGFVSAYILYRAGEATIVDTGVSGSEDAIAAALGEIGLGWDSVGSIVITHRHPDHQGSVPAVLAAADAPWYAGAGDIPAIDAPIEGVAVGDGDRVDEFEIIETPGHTAGHISVFDRAAGVLVAGDAINGGSGGVEGPNPAFSEDMDLANASVAKLAQFDYEVVLFGHGEPVLENASTLVEELARRGD